ncbi:MAG: 2-amino-4-hydroxy-6-hydroxymethyldihydropteridine diphosphokinase [Candidatus Omnitrophota bacterium]|jgi:2-amino-4-hydroxy-6-hydroxymethyldihydropteridine diphosphokinase
MTVCYIGIGSNLGDRRKYINSAIEELKNGGRVKVRRSSSIYETDPIGGVKQGKFLNGVLEVETALSPKSLLKELNDIENRLGRVREAKFGPRTMDLDILYYGDEIINEKELIIPHPEIRKREFVLKGLRELGKI